MHISHSALELYSNRCPYHYKLKYIDKFPYDGQTIHTAYGSAIHRTLANYFIKTNINIEQSFKEKFKNELKNLSEETKLKIFKEDDLLNIVANMSIMGGQLCKLAIEFIDIKFPGWKLIAVELEFNEPIIEYTNKDYEFKGIIDIIIQTPDDIISIIDWKNTSWGWDAIKKNDKWKTYQLTYYKHFYSLQNNIDLDNIKTYFILIKRTAKKDNIEIVNVSVGKKKIKNALKIMNNVLYNIDHNVFPKRKTECKYCPYHYTQYCDAK